MIEFLIFQLLNAVGQVRKAVQINPELPPLPDINSLNLGECFSDFSMSCNILYSFVGFSSVVVTITVLTTRLSRCTRSKLTRLLILLMHFQLLQRGCLHRTILPRKVQVFWVFFRFFYFLIFLTRSGCKFALFAFLSPSGVLDFVNNL